MDNFLANISCYIDTNQEKNTAKEDSSKSNTVMLSLKIK